MLLHGVQADNSRLNVIYGFAGRAHIKNRATTRLDAAMAILNRAAASSKQVKTLPGDFGRSISNFHMQHRKNTNRGQIRKSAATRPRPKVFEESAGNGAAKVMKRRFRQDALPCVEPPRK